MMLRPLQIAKHVRTQPAPITFAFSLVSALLALLVMQLLGTPILDQGACHLGVGLAAVVGALVGVVVRTLRDRPGLRNATWAMVPLAGAFLGMAMQAILLLRRPEARYYVISPGIDSNEPVAYVLAGAPFGALPALLAAVLLWVVLRIANRTPALDARERMLVPLAGTCAILGALAARAASDEELPAVFIVVGLAFLALVEALLADGARMRLLAAVFAGRDPTYEIARLEAAFRECVPSFVAGVAPSSVMVKGAGERGYRHAAREPFALVGESFAATIAPLHRRQRVALVLLGALAVTLTVALATR
jgi:hypothetical protein